MSCITNYIKRASSWDYGTFRPRKHILQTSSGARYLLFSKIFRLLRHFMCANSEGSGETAKTPKPSLVAYVINTIIAWAGSTLIWVTTSQSIKQHRNKISDWHLLALLLTSKRLAGCMILGKSAAYQHLMSWLVNSWYRSISVTWQCTFELFYE